LEPIQFLQSNNLEPISSNCFGGSGEQVSSFRCWMTKHQMSEDLLQ